MRYERIKVREDYQCPKTNRMQTKVFINYHIFNSNKEFIAIIPAKDWQNFRRKEKAKQRRAYL